MPCVSIVVPCYNEESTIHLLLEALYAQTYPRGEIEVIVADGRSSDSTLEVINRFQVSHPDLNILVVDNPQRSIPAGVNRAIKAAQGEYIVRLDAHSMPYPDYVARCVEAVESRLGDNVGGVWEIYPGGQDWLARGIAVAAAHPLAAGDARYRLGGNQPGAVDTVPFGSFRRELVEKIGYFNESLLTNEDYEFNVRVRRSGGKVWIDPEIRTRYFARASLAGLAQQYWRYGYWKARMLLRNPGAIRLRQVAPPLFVISLPILSITALLWKPAAWLLLTELAAYMLALLASGIQSSLKKRDAPLIMSVPLAIATMHLSWGSGFIWGLVPRHG